MKGSIQRPTTGSSTKENMVPVLTVVMVSVLSVFLPGYVTDSQSETAPCTHVSPVDVNHNQTSI